MNEDKSKRRKVDLSSDNDLKNEVVEAIFLFNDPNENDTDGILTLIKGCFKVFDWNLTNKYTVLSHLIANQYNIGTLIKNDDTPIPKEFVTDTFSTDLSATSTSSHSLANKTEVSPAVSSSNYLSLQSRATPRDRGEGGGEEDRPSGEQQSIEDDSYIMAVLSILNIRQYKELSGINDALLNVTRLYGSGGDLKLMNEILSSDVNQIGLVINERLYNLPVELIGKLHQCLKDDIAWSCDEADDDELIYYKFTHLIGISRLYTKKKNSFDREDDSNVYLKPEEDYFIRDALVKFMWPTGDKSKVDNYNENASDSKPEYLPEFMFLYCIPFNKYNGIVKQIAKAFKR